jgi:hypothetical protein
VDRLSDPCEPRGRVDARFYLMQCVLQFGRGHLALAVHSHDRALMRAVPSGPLLSRPRRAAAQATPARWRYHLAATIKGFHNFVAEQ